MSIESPGGQEGSWRTCEGSSEDELFGREGLFRGCGRGDL